MNKQVNRVGNELGRSISKKLLQQQLGADSARRTLRRRLADLVGRGRIPGELGHEAADLPRLKSAG